MKMQQKIIALAVMLWLQLAAGAVQAEAHKKGHTAPAVEQAPASKANPRYVINGGEVYDKKTDLTWQRCSVGQHWKNDVGCVGIVKRFTFEQASLQGSGQWRVPTREELATLIDHQKADAHQSPTIDEVAFPDMDGGALYYWTSQRYSNSTGAAADGWYVYFRNGDVGQFLSSNPEPVRLVRDGR